MLRVFVVEDDALLREHLVELLSTCGAFEVAGVAGSGAEALETFVAAKPDLALVDLGLPDMSGQALIRELSAMGTRAQMMAHTVFDDRANVLEAIKAGASGYVLKGCTPEDLVSGLKSLHAGGAPMSPRIARAVMLELRSSPDAPEPDLLSPRERQLLKLVDEGLTYKQISDALHVSTHTVHSHIKNIYEALHARSRADALAKARGRGLI